MDLNYRKHKLCTGFVFPSGAKWLTAPALSTGNFFDGCKLNFVLLRRKKAISLQLGCWQTGPAIKSSLTQVSCRSLNNISRRLSGDRLLQCLAMFSLVHIYIKYWAWLDQHHTMIQQQHIMGNCFSVRSPV